jgi:alkanesulfonate monooxygenase SsuD/methylene tetrahydromethanopterin reductase-like flavin-dependent oxidoreductase (luciferase family)
MVGCNNYRNPALLAKMASTIDVLSHGRLDFGIGAGWYEHEYRAYGYEYPDGPERLRMLGEALQIFKAMWTEPYASFDGKYYHIEGAINEPKGVQKPHIPIWVGGSGEKVTLKLVAKYADACNIGGVDPAGYRHKFDVLRKHCEDVGRDYNEIIKSAHFSMGMLQPGDDPETATALWRRGESLQKFREGNFIGTSEEAVELLDTLMEAGVEYFIIYFQNDLTKTDVLHQFAEEVMPRVGKGVAVRS